jgi:acyl-lipid omega-6 desaturase (Delta-12 desaturase)
MASRLCLLRSYTMNEKQNSVEKIWRNAIKQYQNPNVRRSVWQLVNSIVPYLIFWGLMVWSLRYGYWLTLLLAVPAGGFLVRVFIIFHDCGHGSFFKSRQANDIFGYITGILVFTPYHWWRYRHAVHHASAGDLDRRGVGDVWTMTLEEYRNANWRKRFIYRVYRHPFIMFIIGPLIVFLISQRFSQGKVKRLERRSVIITNLVLLVILILAHFTIGLKAYFLIQIPAIWLATITGVWLFYVQHQFEGVYWERHEKWDFYKAALNGSSFYKLPKVLQWFTGNIGFHHIHHLSPKIPNYKLEECHNENPILQVQPLTLRDSLKSLYFRLWDEKEKMLVGWNAIKKYKMKMQMNKM